MPRRVPRPTPPNSLLQTPMALLDAELARRATQGDQQAAVEARAMSFREFIPFAWKIVEGRRPYLQNWHIDAKAEHLEAASRGQIKKLLINEPPGLAKSLVASVMWPAWQWGPFGKPETRFLCLSYGGDAAAPACRDAERCRDLIVSPAYQREWGTTFTLSDTQNAKTFYANDRKGYRVSAGLEGTVSGLRADTILIDDPTKLDETTLEQIMKPGEIYERTLQTRAIDDNAVFVLIMQRLHPEDLSGYFLREDGWVHLRLPMFYEADNKCRVFLTADGRVVTPPAPTKDAPVVEPEQGGRVFFEDPRTREGEPLHVGMHRAIEIAAKQARTRPDIYEGQQQQRPTNREGQIVTRIERYDALPHTLDEIILTVDCAFKDGEDNSWVVFQKWARRDANAYLLDQLRRHMELPATCEALVAFSRREPIAPAKFVEAKANGVGVVQILRNRIPGLISTDDDEHVLKPFCAGSKEAKLQAAAPYFQAGNVRIPSSEYLAKRGIEDWTVDYVYELTTFPKSRFDDQVDATSMGVWKLLHTYEAHVDMAELVATKTALSSVAGVFEQAYALERPDVYQQAVQGGVNVADLFRGAYGG